jgi:hypothetical protein
MTKARMDTNKRKLMANLDKMDANQHNMEATIRGGQEETVKSITGACREATEACEGVTHACLEKKEPTPEETEAMEKAWEVPEGAADEEKFGTTEDRAGEQRLAMRRHRQQKKRAQVNGGPWQKFAAFRGQFTRRTIPALLKGHVRKGPRRNRRSGVRGPGKKFRTRIDGRSLKQRQIKGNVARETPEGRMDEKRRQTRPECNSDARKLNKVSHTGKRGRIVKRDQCLEVKRTHHEVTRKSLDLEIAMLIVGSYIGLQEMGHCGSVGPRRSGRGSTLAEPLGAAAIDNVGSRCSESHRGARGKKKRLTTGVGYLRRAALRREQCDMHTVGQQSTVETLFITVAKQCATLVFHS